ncbi:unnamed protein product, partial [Brassica rapa]
MGCLVSTHRTSVGVRQYTHDVLGSLCVSVCVRLCPSAHTGRLCLSISTHISTLIHGLSTLALPVDCLVHIGRPWVSASTHRTSVAHCGCPSAHTQRLWLSICVRMCPSAHTIHPWVSVSTHRTSLCVRQHTHDAVAVRVCPYVSVSTHRTSLAVHSTHISTLVLGLSTLAHPVDCLGDFGPRGLSVQYTHDIRGCLPAHTERLWLTSVAVCVCLCLSVCVCQHTQDVALHQYTYQHAGPWTEHAGPSRGLFGKRRTSVGDRQHTQDVRVCPSAHTGRPCVSVSTHRTSVAVRVCPCVSVCVPHTGHPWLSISTHISTLVLGLSTLALPVDCSGDFGPRGLSVQYTQDVRGCQCVSASTHRTSVAVSVCPCVSVSTHRTLLAVHQYTYQHAGPWTQHAGPSHGLFGIHRTSVCVRQHTQNVRVCPSAQTGRPWLSVSTHRTSVAV